MVLIVELELLPGVVITLHLGIVLNASKEVGAVGIEVSLKIKFVASHEIAAIAGPLDGQGEDLFLFHADSGGSFAIAEEVLEILRARTAAGGDAIETLSVAARVVVNLQLIVSADTELVGYFANGHAFDGLFLHFEILAREFKAMVPKGVLTGTQFLSFFPRRDAHVLAFTA